MTVEGLFATCSCRGRRLAARLAGDDAGLTSVEYGLIAAILAGVIVAAFSGMAPSLAHAITKVANTLDNAGG